MAWSTRRLAELAGSTVKAIRYYHEIGLLAERDSVDVEFENLPADADATVIESLAERMVSAVLRSREKFPEWKDLAADAPGGAKNAEDTIAQAMFSLYNMAQLRVLHELNIRVVRLRLD